MVVYSGNKSSKKINYSEELSMISKEKFDSLSKDFSSKTSTETRRLEDVYRDYSCELISTDMNIQRSYVWTPEQQQALFDSLLIKFTHHN
jgi:uncharacterized protein with ParB-like and HNH nuclease domain